MTALIVAAVVVDIIRIIALLERRHETIATYGMFARSRAQAGITVAGGVVALLAWIDLAIAAHRLRDAAARQPAGRGDVASAASRGGG